MLVEVDVEVLMVDDCVLDVTEDADTEVNDVVRTIDQREENVMFNFF